MSLLFFIRCENVLLFAFLCLFPSLCFFLCQFQKPFFLSPDLHSSPSYPFLSLSLILQAVKAVQTACSENKNERTVSETEPQHFTFCLPHFLSSPFLFLSLIKWPTCLSGSYLEGCLTAGVFIFIHLSSLSSPLLCSVEVRYIIPLGIQGGR